MQSVKSDKEDASSAQNALQCRRTAEMQQRLQHAAAHGQRLIRGGGAVGGLSPGVHIAAFHAGEYLQSRLQQSPEAAIDGADHGNTVYGGGDVSGPDQLSNFHAGCKDTCRRCPEYPLGAFAADLAGMPVLGSGLPLYSVRPSVWPRMVSTAAWQSMPTVKPGPMPMTTGASVIAVPKFRFARMASTTAAGRS